jgi:DNA-binding response OmpR family regulator
MQQRTILLVEPDSALRASWRAGLQSMGFALIEAGDAASGLRAALASEVSLLVTELYLPSDGSRCLVLAARREPGLRRLKILVVTDHDSDDDRTWALASGADAYLLKPVRLGRMLQVSARLATTRGPGHAELRVAR